MSICDMTTFKNLKVHFWYMSTSHQVCMSNPFLFVIPRVTVSTLSSDKPCYIFGNFTYFLHKKNK